MPEPSPAPRAALAELLVTAAAELAASLPPLPVPDGRPVIRGRVALGRYRRLVDRDGCCAVAVGFASGVRGERVAQHNVWHAAVRDLGNALSPRGRIYCDAPPELDGGLPPTGKVISLPTGRNQ